MADYETIMRALRNAHAAGDTAAAKRLAQMARSAQQGQQPQAAPTQDTAPAQTATQPVQPQSRQIVPGGYEVGTGQLATQGPGPGGYIDPELYRMGAIGRRMQPGEPAAQPTQMVERTGTEMPQVVRAADGTEFYLDPRTGQYTDRTGMKMNADRQTGIGQALGAGYMSGYTLNAADEAAGAVGGARTREQWRAMQDANREAHPIASIVGEIAGAVSNPVLRAIPAARSIMGAVGIGGGTAAVDAFNRGEGDIRQRGADAVEGGILGALFTLPFAAAGKGISKALDGFMDAAQKRPSLESYRGVKTAAYKAVDDAGDVFSGDDMTNLAERAKSILQAADFDDIADPQTGAAYRMLDARRGQEVTLSRLDRIRQKLWERYNRGEEPVILDLIEAVDDLIDTKADASLKMRVARDANKAYRRVEMLELAFRKAELQTDATGSGGNILNKYRQAVTSIITDPKRAKWFTPEQIAVMESFVQGNMSENTLRRIGKMAPGGSGLMTFLNFYGATLDPTFLAVTGAAQAAKTSADNMAIFGKEGVLDAVAGFQPPAPTGPGLNPIGIGAGVSADNAWEAR